jgi:hypothetical protein
MGLEIITGWTNKSNGKAIWERGGKEMIKSKGKEV